LGGQSLSTALSSVFMLLAGTRWSGRRGPGGGWSAGLAMLGWAGRGVAAV